MGNSIDMQELYPYAIYPHATIYRNFCRNGYLGGEPFVVGHVPRQYLGSYIETLSRQNS